MKHIPSETLAQLKEKLEQMRAQTQEQIERTLESSPVNDPDRLSDNEAGDDAVEEVEILQSDVLSDHLETRLKEIESALARIEQGSYGKTADGIEIPVARLLIDPTVQTVVVHDDQSK